MRTRTLVVAGALATALGGAVVWGAQTSVRSALESHGRCGPLRFLMGMHDAMRDLDLTADQRTQIKGILRSHRDEFHEILDRLRTEHEAVRQAADQDTIDEAAIRERVAAAAGPLGDLAVLHAKVHHEISAVLTPEQREKAKALHEKMSGHIHEMRMHFHDVAGEMLEDAS
jgi:periplasmic protein CpxP/Spy